MITGLRRLTKFDWTVVVAGLWLVVLIPDLVDGPPSEADIRNEARVSWARTADGHAAFAEGGDGRYGWTTGYHSAQAAALDALALCRSGETVCKITETYGYTRVPSELGVPVSLQTAAFFDTYMREGGAKALAMNLSGVVGYSYEEVSQDAARAAALEACNVRDTSDLDDLMRRPCEVVHVSP